MKTKGAQKPACWTKTDRHPWGNACPVYDVVTDPELNRLASAFLEAEALGKEAGYGKMVERLLDESGLSQETTGTLLALRRVVKDHQKREADKVKRQKGRA